MVLAREMDVAFPDASEQELKVRAERRSLRQSPEINVVTNYICEQECGAVPCFLSPSSKPNPVQTFNVERLCFCNVAAAPITVM